MLTPSPTPIDKGTNKTARTNTGVCTRLKNWNNGKGRLERLKRGDALVANKPDQATQYNWPPSPAPERMAESTSVSKAKRMLKKSGYVMGKNIYLPSIIIFWCVCRVEVSPYFFVSLSINSCIIINGRETTPHTLLCLSNGHLLYVEMASVYITSPCWFLSSESSYSYWHNPKRPSSSTTYQREARKASSIYLSPLFLSQRFSNCPETKRQIKSNTRPKLDIKIENAFSRPRHFHVSAGLSKHTKKSLLSLF